jgi:branched-chain amino acid transport system substrate-binding protein
MGQKYFPGLTFVFILIGMLFFLSCSQGGEKTITIGFAGPLSGDDAQFGEDIARGVEIAIDEINQKGGLLGCQLELIKLDDKADPREASNSAAKLIANSKVVGVVGHLNSGCSIPASVQYNRAGMVMVSPSSTADDLTNQGYPEVFRVVLKDSAQGPAAAVFAKDKLNATRICVLNDKTAYGKGLAEAFKNKSIELGMEIVLEDSYNKGEKDFSTLVTKIAATNPDIIYTGSMYTEPALLMSQARPRGLTATFMGGDGLFAPKLMEIGGDATEGTIISFLAPPWEETETATTFLQTYKTKYGEDVKSFAPLAYNAMMTLAEGIRRAGVAERAAIVKAMRAPDFNLEAIGGRIEFDEKGDIKGKEPFFYIVKNGKFELYKDDIPQEESTAMEGATTAEDETTGDNSNAGEENPENK